MFSGRTGTALRRRACSRVRFATLLIFTWMLGGCQTGPHPIGPVSPPSLEQSLRQRSEHWRRFQAECRIRVKGPNRTDSFQAIVSADLPDDVRMEALSPWGQTLGILVTNPQQSSLWITGEKVIYRASNSALLLHQLTGMALPAQQFASLLVAAFPGEVLRENPNVAGDSCGLQLFADGNTVSGIGIRCRDGLYQVRYEPPFVVIPGKTPESLVVDYGDWELQVRLRRVRTLTTSPAGWFRLSPPANVRQIRLGEVRP